MISVSHSLTELDHLVESKARGSSERAAREFEALILSEMMKAGAKPMFEETLLDGGSAGRMARDQLYAQLALEASRGAGLGLSDQLIARAKPDEPESGIPR